MSKIVKNICWFLMRNLKVASLISIIDVKSRLPTFQNYTLHVYWFLRFFPTSIPRLLELCTSFFQKIPPSMFIPTSTFIDLATFAPPPRLFQPPLLLERWEYGLLELWFYVKVIQISRHMIIFKACILGG